MRCDEAMTDMDSADTAALVPGAHRLVRAVDAHEGPHSGTLVVHENGVVLAVAAERLTGWGGWAHAGAEHVCGPVDLRRRRDGQDALLPWCTQRLETFLGRRRAGGVLLAPGELTTLVASLLRGVHELGPDASDAVGDWWLTGMGLPLFFHGEGGASRVTTAALIERLIPHAADRATVRILEEMTTALRERRHPHDDDVRWEEQLFATAAPRALRMEDIVSEQVVDVRPRQAREVADDAHGRTRRSRRAAQTSNRLLRRARDAARRLMVAVRAGGSAVVAVRRWRTDADSRRSAGDGRRSSSTRRRALLVAGAIAGLVLVVGLLWPQGQDSAPANAVQGVQEPTAIVAEPSTTPAGDEAESGSEEQREEEALGALPRLLDEIAACVLAASDVCPAALADGLSMPVEGSAVQGAAATTATLIDDYGDVVVMKLVPVDASAESSDQMLVLERREEKWLVRDIYEVAHQPE